jgi:hypothetical protein
VRRPEAVKLEDVVLLIVGDDGRRARMRDGKTVEFPRDAAIPDLERGELGCPLCGRTDTLYENVELSGWRSVVGHQVVEMDETVVVPSISDGHGGLSREVDWDSAEHENYACSECCTDGTYLERLALVVPPKSAGTAAR